MTLAEIQEEAKMLISSDNVPGSLEFAEKLEKSLIENNVRDTNPNAYRELSKIVFQLYVTAIPNIKDDLFHKIISLNLIEALNPIWESERDLATRIESRYSIYPIELIKEMMRKDILDLVKKNNQLIGTVPLRLSQDDPQVKPTIQNWLEYYDRATGSTSVKNFKRSVFMSGDTVVQTLTPQEKEILRKVISFYDYLQTDDTVLYADLHNSETIDNKNYNLNYTPPKTQFEIPNIPNKINVEPKIIAKNNQTDTRNNTNSVSSSTTITPMSTQNVIKRSPAPVVLQVKPKPAPQNVINLRK